MAPIEKFILKYHRHSSTTRISFHLSPSDGVTFSQTPLCVKMAAILSRTMGSSAPTRLSATKDVAEVALAPALSWHGSPSNWQPYPSGFAVSVAPDAKLVHIGQQQGSARPAAWLPSLPPARSARIRGVVEDRRLFHPVPESRTPSAQLQTGFCRRRPRAIRRAMSAIDHQTGHRMECPMHEPSSPAPARLSGFSPWMRARLRGGAHAADVTPFWAHPGITDRH